MIQPLILSSPLDQSCRVGDLNTSSIVIALLLAFSFGGGGLGRERRLCRIYQVQLTDRHGKEQPLQDQSDEGDEDNEGEEGQR